MKKSLFTLLAMMLLGTAFAQPTSSYYQQQFDASVYEDYYALVAAVSIDGEIQNDYNLELGAWDEVHQQYVGGALAEDYSAYYADGPEYWMLVYGYPAPSEATDPEQSIISFRLYNHETQEELDVICFDRITWTNGSSGLPNAPRILEFYTHRVMDFNPTPTDNNWETLGNWTVNGEEAESLPGVSDDVFINGKCVFNEAHDVYSVTVNPTGILTNTSSSNTFFYINASQGILVKDGGQIFTPNKANYNMTATFEKTIEGYASEGYTSERNNYYFISIPYNVAIENIESEYTSNGMVSGDYDLYYFDQKYPNSPDDDEMNGEWRNFKYYQENGYISEGDDEDPYGSAYWHTNTSNSTSFGYLYANSQTTTLQFNGRLYTANNAYGKTITLEYIDEDSDYGYSADPRAIGFNLIGNPHSCNASVAASTGDVDGYYVMNEGRNDVIAQDDPIVGPCTALFAKVSGTGNKVRFTKSEGEANVRNMGTPRINVEVLSNNGLVEDRAYVRMEESNDLVKFNLRNDGTKIYIPQNGKKYAAVYNAEAKAMPLCFTSTKGGIHTISVKLENTDCSYLHLIDNVTGADIDLLRTPKYTFNADDSHYTTRFKLVFDEQASNEIVDSFAFISNGELMINNSGEATLQVMDITGRILSSETIQNCYSKNLNLSAGVYVVRLSNGNDVKAQKIVVE